MKKKIENKIIEQIIFLYLIVRNFKISKYWSFYITSFQILTPTQFFFVSKITCCFCFVETCENFEYFIFFGFCWFK